MSKNDWECSICHCNEGSPFVLECDHKFHTDCIMAWFRSGHSTCPMCRDSGISVPISVTGAPGSMARFEHIRRISKMGNAPKLIKQQISDVVIIEKQLDSLEEALEDYISTADGKYVQIIRNISRKEKAIRRLKNRLSKRKRCISFQNCDRIIIPVKKQCF